MYGPYKKLLGLALVFCFVLVFLSYASKMCQGQALSQDVLRDLQSSATEVSVNISFGNVLAGKTTKKTFRIKNPFECDISIVGLERSCGCTVPRIKNTSVKNGEEIEIEIDFSVGNNHGINKKDLLLYCNGGTSNYILRLQLIASVRAFIVLETTTNNCWFIDPAHVDKSKLVVRILNYFERGDAPVVKLDEFDEVQSTLSNITEHETDAGVIAAWQATFVAPHDWMDLGKIPQLKMVSASQTFSDGPKQAESFIAVKMRTSLVVRPRKLDLELDEDCVEADVIVSLADWSVGELIATSAIVETMLPFEVIEHSSNFVKVRFSRSIWRNLLGNEKCVRIGLSNQNVYSEWEIVK